MCRNFNVATEVPKKLPTKQFKLCSTHQRHSVPQDIKVYVHVHTQKEIRDCRLQCDKLKFDVLELSHNTSNSFFWAYLKL